MATARQKTLLRVVLTVVAALGTAVPSAVADGPVSAESPRSDRILFVMYLRHDGPGTPWGLTLGKNRSARVTIEGKDHVIDVSPPAFASIVDLLKTARFNELDNSYGTPLVDREYRVIDAWIDGKKKRVSLYSDLADDPRRDQVARALRVWNAARDLFEIPGAIDTRAEDRKLAQLKEQ